MEKDGHMGQAGQSPVPAPTAAAGQTAASKPMRVVCDRVIEAAYDVVDEEAAVAFFAQLYDPLSDASPAGGSPAGAPQAGAPQTGAPQAGGSLAGGCSAVRVRVGDKVYVGRNLDFYCSDTPAFIVRNNSGKIRTLGIGNSPDTLDPWCEGYQVKPQKAAVLPYLCCDVMSEAGIYVETNIRPLEPQFACWQTNPGAPRRCTQLFMQTMLSRYATIDEILAHVDDYDWYDLAKMGFHQAFFLTDQSGRSVIVEFACNSWRWHEAEYNANFFIDDEWYAAQTIGCGEQRISRELAYKPFVRNEADVFAMMQRGAYDQFYHQDVDVDFAIPEFYDCIGYNRATAAADPEGARAAAALKIAEFSAYTWEERIANKSWESVFITAANVTDLVMHTHFSEHYGIDLAVAFE